MKRSVNLKRSLHRAMTDADVQRIATFVGPKTCFDLIGDRSEDRKPPRHRRNPFIGDR